MNIHDLASQISQLCAKAALEGLEPDKVISVLEGQLDGERRLKKSKEDAERWL